MRKLLFLVVVLLVMTGWVLAQNNTQTGNQSGQTSTQSTTTTQSGQSGQTGATADQTQTGTASGQTGANAKGGRLPATASPLPLLGLLGIGSLGAGLVARKRKH